MEVKMKKFYLMFSLILTFMLVSFQLQAKPPKDKPEPAVAGFHFLEKCLDSPKVGLTEDQKAKISAIRNELRENWKQAQATMKDLRKSIRDDFLNTKISNKDLKDKILDTHKKIQTIMEDFFKINVDKFIKIRELLSPHQLDAIQNCKPPKMPEKEK
jgi:Spy/CpxP family protein refolding chaperone